MPKAIAPKPLPVSYWMKRCEKLIEKNSGPVYKSGKFKGHSETDVLGWVIQLTREVDNYLQASAKNQKFDGNMALASYLGMVLVAWSVNVGRAKCYDENRPLKLRRMAYEKWYQYRTRMFQIMIDDMLIGEVWPDQKLRPPFGKGAKGGKFV